MLIAINPMISSSNHMFARAIWDKLPEWNESNLNTFKNHEGDLSQKFPEPNIWLPFYDKKPKNTLHWN